MAALKQRHNKFEARVRIPAIFRVEYGGKELLYRTLAAADRRSAKLEAAAWELSLKVDWASRAAPSGSPAVSLRGVYETFRSIADDGRYRLSGDVAAFDDLTAGIEFELERMSEEIGERDFTTAEQAKVWALQDTIAQRTGTKVKKRPALEPSFREIADEHLKLWRIAPGRKETNTGQQKVATFDLFASFFGDKPIRQVGRADASTFVDALRQLDPSWARTGKAKDQTAPMTWKELNKLFGGRQDGLSDATVNRHMATLSALWKWAEERERCDGRNPFLGHRRNLKEGRNKRGYVSWQPKELEALFNPPPKRSDLTEVMLVAMYTGMRLNEIASLTFGQLLIEEGVALIDVTDAKTVAGERKVPLHPKLAWLKSRAKGKPPEARVWPKFVAEGPGGKPGGDAGKEFSRFKLALGFTDRRKAFHSLRKNVVGQLEVAGVPENEVALLVGHEKRGFTFKTYGSKNLLQRMAEIVALIDYPGVSLPEPKGN